VEVAGACASGSYALVTQVSRVPVATIAAWGPPGRSRDKVTGYGKTSISTTSGWTLADPVQADLLPVNRQCDRPIDAFSPSKDGGGAAEGEVWIRLGRCDRRRVSLSRP